MALHHLFEDAHRRICIAKQRGKADDPNVWVGMQMPSAMKEMIACGYMVPVSKETPRVLNWYKFTSEGWAEYHRRFEGAPNYFDDAFGSFHQKVTYAHAKATV